MIHPQYWSLYSIYNTLRKRSSLLTIEDKKSYATLDVKGKIVLDVGASDGDSARFFLNRGAKQIICIEPDLNLAKRIKDPRCKVITERFKLEHLDIPHDCMKMDIEGWEEVLLKFDSIELKPSVIEVHGQQLIEKFRLRGWFCIYNAGSAHCIAHMINYPLILEDGIIYRG